MWLLWGDFCFTLMQTLIPPVLQLKLRDLGASNWTIGLLITTIPAILNMTVAPVASFRSDRFRSRWGRRIPFLLVGTLPLTACLLLIGFSEDIGRFVGARFLASQSSTSIILVVFGISIVAFQFFNMIIGSVYYYLFNDVVPREFLSRFMAMFRVVGIVAAGVFNWFLLEHSVAHTRAIFVGSALLYCVAFILMCWKVKEGDYPPPPEPEGHGSGWLGGVKTFFTECFSDRFYWWFYLANTFYMLTNVAAGFIVLQAKSIGIDVSFYGKTTAVAGFITAALLYPAGSLADRFHPLKMLILATILMILIQPLWLLFIFFQFDTQTSHWLFVAITSLTVPATALYVAAELPTYMRVLPQDRYGQFCSANAMVRSLAMVGGGVLLGGLLDFISPFLSTKDVCYRYVPLWTLGCYGLSLLFLYRLYVLWKVRGSEAGLPHHSPKE